MTTEYSPSFDNLESVPDALYKFMHRKDIHYITEFGTLRLCSNIFYQKNYYAMEIKNHFINDPAEGFESSVQRRDLDLSKDTPTESELAHIKAFIGTDNIVGGKFFNNAIQNVSDTFHMMCFTLGHPDKIAPIFTKEYGGPPYNACIKLNRISELLKKINSEGTIDELGNERIFNIFRTIVCDKVEYVKKFRTWEDDPLVPSPFNKDTDFSDQEEYRIVFIPWYKNYIPDVLTCRIPGLGDFVEVIPLEG